MLVRQINKVNEFFKQLLSAERQIIMFEMKSKNVELNISKKKKKKLKLKNNNEV